MDRQMDVGDTAVSRRNGTAVVSGGGAKDECAALRYEWIPFGSHLTPRIVSFKHCLPTTKSRATTRGSCEEGRGTSHKHGEQTREENKRRTASTGFANANKTRTNNSQRPRDSKLRTALRGHRCEMPPPPPLRPRCIRSDFFFRIFGTERRLCPRLSPSHAAPARTPFSSSPAVFVP